MYGDVHLTSRPFGEDISEGKTVQGGLALGDLVLQAGEEAAHVLCALFGDLAGGCSLHGVGQGEEFCLKVIEREGGVVWGAVLSQRIFAVVERAGERP